MYIGVPVALVVGAVVWAVVDYHQDQSPYLPDKRERRRRELTRFCLQVALVAPVSSLCFYIPHAAGRPEFGIVLLVIFWGGIGALYGLRSRRRQATHPPE